LIFVSILPFQLTATVPVVFSSFLTVQFVLGTCPCFCFPYNLCLALAHAFVVLASSLSPSPQSLNHHHYLIIDRFFPPLLLHTLQHPTTPKTNSDSSYKHLTILVSGHASRPISHSAFNRLLRKRRQDNQVRRRCCFLPPSLHRHPVHPPHTPSCAPSRCLRRGGRSEGRRVDITIIQAHPPIPSPSPFPTTPTASSTSSAGSSTSSTSRRRRRQRPSTTPRQKRLLQIIPHRVLQPTHRPQRGYSKPPPSRIPTKPQPKRTRHGGQSRHDENPPIVLIQLTRKCPS